MVVVLPAPFGPRNPKTSPVATSRSIAAHRFDRAVLHAEVVNLDRGRAHRDGNVTGVPF